MYCSIYRTLLISPVKECNLCRFSSYSLDLGNNDNVMIKGVDLNIGLPSSLGFTIALSQLILSQLKLLHRTPVTEIKLGKILYIGQ